MLDSFLTKRYLWSLISQWSYTLWQGSCGLKRLPILLYIYIALRKHAYSNILKILPPKSENFQMKILIFFHLSAKNIDCGTRQNRLGDAVLTSTHNLCFWAEIRKLMYTQWSSNFVNTYTGLVYCVNENHGAEIYFAFFFLLFPFSISHCNLFCKQTSTALIRAIFTWCCLNVSGRAKYKGAGTQHFQQDCIKRSICAPAQSDQTLPPFQWTLWGTKDPRRLQADSEDSEKPAPMHRVFFGGTRSLVGNAVTRLISDIWQVGHIL